MTSKKSTLFSAGIFSNIRGDIYGGITVAVVALPLALAFGTASGLGPVSGLYSAIALGFFAALFGGTKCQISGPTGPITVIMAAIVVQYQHDPAMVFTIVMLAGLFQILFGAIKIGRYITYIPYPVISGFMSGIGLIIIILQLGVLAGYKAPDQVMAVLPKLPGFWAHPYWPAVSVGLTALGIMIFMPKSWRNILPPPLAALAAATLLSLFVVQGAPVLGEVPKGLPDIHLPKFTLDALPNMLGSALIIALLGTIDSILTSLVADTFTHTQHNSDRELIGQGIGNMVAGLIGGIAGSGATMRTVTNIRAGGRTPLSGMFHALLLLAFLVGLGFVIADIPRAALAGVLIKIGWDIIDWRFLRQLKMAGMRGVEYHPVVIMLVVAGLTVFVDLIMAVFLGILMQSLITADSLAKHQIEEVEFSSKGTLKGKKKKLRTEEKKLLQQAGERLLLLRFAGPLSFGTARDLAARLHLVSRFDSIVIDFSDCKMMDVSIMMTISDMITELTQDCKTLFLCGTENEIYARLKKYGILSPVPENQIFTTRLEALQAAVAQLENNI
jgi:SulP family sulfate permease